VSAHQRSQRRAGRDTGRGAVVLSTLVIAVIGVGAATVLAVLAGILFEHSKRDTFWRSVAELLLQLALVAILGALVKWLFDSYAARKARLDADNAKRIDLLRRVRSQHVKVAHAQRLIIAHNSGRTYVKQLRVLMLAIPELEDVAEDIRAAADTLFGEDRPTIVNGLRAMIAYLEKGAAEYSRSHRYVDTNALLRRSLDVSIRRHNMAWLRDLKASADCFPVEYSDAVDASKGLIRANIYSR
jgi:uncharacterized membrane protein